MTTNRMPAVGREQKLNLALWAIGAVAVIMGTQWLAVLVQAFFAGVPTPTLSWLDLLGLYGQPDPSVVSGLPVPGWVHWTVLTGFVVVASAGLIALVLFRQKRRDNPENLDGLATGDEIRRIASGHALLKRAAVLRPSLSAVKPRLEQLGFYLGRARGLEIWASVEDAIILLGPSRSGKGLNFIVSMILNAPGAVVTTSTRADNLSLTMKHRERNAGPLYLFDPAGNAEGVGHALRWSPISGCEDPDVVLRRLSSLVPPGAFGGTQNGGHWEAKAQEVAKGLFHAAALGGKTVEDIWGWVVDPKSAMEAVELILNDPRGERLWAAALRTILESDAEQRDREWGTARTVLKYLDAPTIRKWLMPDEGDEGFDIPTFLRERGTLYLIGDDAAAIQFQPVIVALFEEISYVAQGLAAASPGARLDPPAQFILDEAANFKIPSLPKLISYSGGSGLTVVVVLQSISQARSAWGDNEQKAMWGASSLKVVLPGGADPADLRDLETLIGQVEVTKVSVTDNDNSGSKSYSRQYQAILQAAKIRTLPFGTGLIFFRQAAPIVARLRPWTQLPIADEIKLDKKDVDEQLRAASRYAGLFTPAEPLEAERDESDEDAVA